MIDIKLLETTIADQDRSFAKKALGVPREVNFDKYLTTRQIVVISGVRRSGKSTLLAQFGKRMGKFHFVTFDDERLLNFTVEDFQNLLVAFKKRHNGQTILLDEVENVVGWERFARRLHDEGYRVFVTGSNAKLLSSELATHLTGRYLKIELFPFSFREFLLFRKLSLSPQTTDEHGATQKAFDEYVTIGGFPEMAATGDAELLLRLYEDIIYKDLIVRFKIRDVKLFRQLTQFLFTNIGAEVSYNGLAKLLGAKSAVSVKRYVTFMAEAYLLGEVYKYNWSLKKQFISNKKTYVIDLGLRGEVAFNFSENSGHLLENIVYLELRRRGKEVFYFKNNRECDFVVKEKNQIAQAIQMTMALSAQNQKREVEGLVEAMEHCRVNSGVIITYSERKTIKQGRRNIQVLPITEWLLQERILDL